MIGKYALLLFTNPEFFFSGYFFNLFFILFRNATATHQFTDLLKHGIESCVSAPNHSVYVHSFLLNISQTKFRISGSSHFLPIIESQISKSLSDNLTKFVIAVATDIAKDMRSMDLLSDKYLEPLKAFQALVDVPALALHVF